jgi:hypothetical protein
MGFLNDVVVVAPSFDDARVGAVFSAFAAALIHFG